MLLLLLSLLLLLDLLRCLLLLLSALLLLLLLVSGDDLRRLLLLLLALLLYLPDPRREIDSRLRDDRVSRIAAARSIGALLFLPLALVFFDFSDRVFARVVELFSPRKDSVDLRSGRRVRRRECDHRAAVSFVVEELATFAHRCESSLPSQLAHLGPRVVHAVSNVLTAKARTMLTRQQYALLVVGLGSKPRCHGLLAKARRFRSVVVRAIKREREHLLERPAGFTVRIRPPDVRGHHAERVLVELDRLVREHVEAHLPVRVISYLIGHLVVLDPEHAWIDALRWSRHELDLARASDERFATHAIGHPRLPGIAAAPEPVRLVALHIGRAANRGIHAKPRRVTRLELIERRDRLSAPRAALADVFADLARFERISRGVVCRRMMTGDERYYRNHNNTHHAHHNRADILVACDEL
ncbi:MAG TPA: hypothetical protein VMZ53_28035 [Kofleriaceae bacterium]|nr:hypothetical protein [Kofleriaceae bacterium]